MFGLMNFKMIGAVAIGLAVLATFLYVRHLQNENKTLTAQVTVLSVQIEQQNAAIQQMKVDADIRLKSAEEALAKAQAETVKAKAKAQNIFKAKPSTPGDACKSALDLMNGASK